MPVDPGKYFRLVEHDRDLLDLLSALPPHLINRDFSDWVVTTTFYITCIYMKAYFQTKGIDIQDHITIRKLINTDPTVVSIAYDYRKLEEASRDARYEGRTFDANKLKERVLSHYNRIRLHLVGIIKCGSCRSWGQSPGYSDR